jgi:F-type H+-transporting ATPase subunit b
MQSLKVWHPDILEFIECKWKEEAKARILKEAEAAAEKLKVQAQKNIESEIQRAKAQLQEEILDNALSKAEALIKEKINADDQEKLVDEYLAKVVAS